MHKLLGRDQDTLVDEGISSLSSRLGLVDDTTLPVADLQPAAFEIVEATACARNLFYAPNMDGQVDPGEVVFFLAQGDNASDQPQERALIVVGRIGDQITGLLTSPNPNNQWKKTWIDIGAGPWDTQGRQAWARVDKVIRISESDIRRQGAVIPPARFERIAMRLRDEYGWA